MHYAAQRKFTCKDFCIGAFHPFSIRVFKQKNYSGKNLIDEHTNIFIDLLCVCIAFLVSKLNPQFRRIWNPYCLTDNAICSTEFMVYKPKDITLRPICYAIANSDGFYNHMVSKATSSTGSRKRIQPDVSIKYSLAFPLDRFVVDRFCSHYGPIMEKIKKTKLENYELKNSVTGSCPC